MSGRQLKRLVERLTGKPTPIPRDDAVFEAAYELLEKEGLGYSQLNELLLFLGYDRVNESFFQFLVDGTTRYRPGAAIERSEHNETGLGALEDGTGEFQRLALLLYGNIQYAFEQLSQDAEHLERQVEVIQPLGTTAFEQRHDPIHLHESIPGDETYYLGYLVRQQLAERASKRPDDPAIAAEQAKLENVVETGRRNQEAYLASDHLDVYVATSMRRPHEYLQVSRWTERIFDSARLQPLKLRYFDPTQAYCSDRIDKGLAEALMLKRAACTLYFAQESDTFGKDSELASTLAQGKTVIAFVPEGSEKVAEELLELVYEAYDARTEQARKRALIEQMKVFDPTAAWDEPEVRRWIDHPEAGDLERMEARLQEKIISHYDQRASTLEEHHPLGIQVNLETGVANGVLVARTERQCADLVYDVVTRSLQFEIEEKPVDGRTYWLLKERRTGSIYRVMSGDRLLTNSFWNFYSREP